MHTALEPPAPVARGSELALFTSVYTVGSDRSPGTSSTRGRPAPKNTRNILKPSPRNVARGSRGKYLPSPSNASCKILAMFTTNAGPAETASRERDGSGFRRCRRRSRRPRCGCRAGAVWPTPPSRRAPRRAGGEPRGCHRPGATGAGAGGGAAAAVRGRHLRSGLRHPALLRCCAPAAGGWSASAHAPPGRDAALRRALRQQGGARLVLRRAAAGAGGPADSGGDRRVRRHRNPVLHQDGKAGPDVGPGTGTGAPTPARRGGARPAGAGAPPEGGTSQVAGCRRDGRGPAVRAGPGGPGGPPTGPSTIRRPAECGAGRQPPSCWWMIPA